MGIIDEITILEKYSEDMSPADTYKCKLKRIGNMFMFSATIYSV